MFPTARVLLAGGGEPSILALQQMLESAGHAVWRADSITDATRRIGVGAVDVVVLSHDLMTAADQLVEAQCATHPASFVVMGRARAPAWHSDAVRDGAWDLVYDTDDVQALLVAVERAAREGRMQRELAMLRARVGDAARDALVGRSSAMTGVRELVGRAAASRAPVLVIGESGTGKNLVARLVHDLSARATRPLVTVRCAGTDAKALELELFGRARGEGTDARAGALESTSGGTLVLDEAQALPAMLRARLARASSARTTQRVGAEESVPIDVRLILTARVEGQSGATPTEELISRFNAMVIDVPPLRDRRSDIPQLVQHFRKQLATTRASDVTPLPPDVMLSLLGREWLGNVRELEQWVERSAAGVPEEQIKKPSKELPGVDLSTSQPTLEELERVYILHVLALESGHQSRTAARLGIDRRTLYRKLRQYRREQ